MTRKLMELSSNQMKKMLSKWEDIVELYRKAKNSGSLRKWGIFFLELIKLAAPVILKWILKKLVKHFLKSF